LQPSDSVEKEATPVAPTPYPSAQSWQRPWYPCRPTGVHGRRKLRTK